MAQKDIIFRSLPRKVYLKAILKRMDTEYLKILKFIMKYNHTHKRGIGFWSLVRIIFPVIETIAYVLDKKKEDFLEKDLNVPYAYVVWEIYRHSLMHTDELRYVVYREKNISWAVHLGSEDIGHIIENEFDGHPTTIHISIPKLYFALREVIIRELSKKNNPEVKIQVGVHFPTYTAQIIEELEDIYKNH